MTYYETLTHVQADVVLNYLKNHDFYSAIKEMKTLANMRKTLYHLYPEVKRIVDETEKYFTKSVLEFIRDLLEMGKISEAEKLYSIVEEYFKEEVGRVPEDLIAISQRLRNTEKVILE